MATKLGSGDPQVLGPMLFLLLVMSPFLLSASSFQHNVPVWRNLYHHLSQDLGSFYQSAHHYRNKADSMRHCNGAFDLYFVLDVSDSAKSNWDDIQKYLDELVNKYTNPKLRMSFITYSTVGQTLMKLTSNKQEIQEALAKLKTVVPTSDRNMQEGFKKANEQIQRVFLRDSNAASLIISLTTGPLLPKTVRETKNEVNIAQSMGAKVYSMGVNKYKKGQLLKIVGNSQMYGRNDYNTFDEYINSLVENSCLDVMKEDSFVACVGEIYNLGFFVNGLERAKMDNYVCRYNLDTTKVYSKKSTNITSEKLICPGHVFEKAGQVVIVEYSLDNSVSFENITLKVTSKDCDKETTVSPTTQSPAPLSIRTSAPPPAPPFIRTSAPPSAPPAIPPLAPPATPPLVTPATPPLVTPATPPPAPPAIPPPALPPVTPPRWPPISPPHQPPAQPSALPPRPPPPPQFIPTMGNLYLVGFILVLLMFPLLFCCIRCCKREIKTCPTVIISCCGCQENRIRRMEGKLDTLCDFVQSCNQRRCINFTLMKPYLGQLPCSPKLCLGPSQEYFSLNSCCSWCHQPPPICSQPTFRMLPLIASPARALCRTTLSLPPP